MNETCAVAKVYLEIWSQNTNVFTKRNGKMPKLSYVRNTTSKRTSSRVSSTLATKASSRIIIRMMNSLLVVSRLWITSSTCFRHLSSNSARIMHLVVSSNRWVNVPCWPSRKNMCMYSMQHANQLCIVLGEDKYLAKDLVMFKKADKWFSRSVTNCSWCRS